MSKEQPIMLCAYCGRDEESAKASGHNFCLAPFDQREHEFTKQHPYLKMYRDQPKGAVAAARPTQPPLPEAPGDVEAVREAFPFRHLTGLRSGIASQHG